MTKRIVISWNRFTLKTLTNSESLPKGVAHFELWILNWAQAASSHQRGGIINCGTGATGRTGATSRTGRTGRELWILNWAQAARVRQGGLGYELQACASGGERILNCELWILNCGTGGTSRTNGTGERIMNFEFCTSCKLAPAG